MPTERRSTILRRARLGCENGSWYHWQILRPEVGNVNFGALNHWLLSILKDPHHPHPQRRHASLAPQGLFVVFLRAGGNAPRPGCFVFGWGSSAASLGFTGHVCLGRAPAPRPAKRRRTLFLRASCGFQPREPQGSKPWGVAVKNLFGVCLCLF